jgi:hypothetical protein
VSSAKRTACAGKSPSSKALNPLLASIALTFRFSNQLHGLLWFQISATFPAHRIVQMVQFGRAVTVRGTAPVPLGQTLGELAQLAPTDFSRKSRVQDELNCGREIILKRTLKET